MIPANPAMWYVRISIQGGQPPKQGMLEGKPVAHSLVEIAGGWEVRVHSLGPDIYQMIWVWNKQIGVGALRFWSVVKQRCG